MTGRNQHKQTEKQKKQNKIKQTQLGGNRSCREKKTLKTWP